MSGLDTQTHTHTHTQNDYRNPRCACAPRVNDTLMLFISVGVACRIIIGLGTNQIRRNKWASLSYGAFAQIADSLWRC